MSQTTVEPAVETGTEAEAPQDEVLAELLIEEISIDGMCGVY
ncbi:MAG: hypothetical protein QOF18_2561 [Frankiaceae bacterium]|jgi:mycofactocin precursor|nr:hypothetical protein [Frankiaceae bacterium]